MSQVAPPPAAPELGEKLPATAFILAIVLGILGALGASVFILFMDSAQTWIWKDLPAAFGFTELPMWWVVLMLLIGAGVVALAWRLPGATGNSPLTGFHFDTPAINAPSILLAALGTLFWIRARPRSTAHHHGHHDRCALNARASTATGANGHAARRRRCHRCDIR